MAKKHFTMKGMKELKKERANPKPASRQDRKGKGTK